MSNEIIVDNKKYHCAGHQIWWSMRGYTRFEDLEAAWEACATQQLKDNVALPARPKADEALRRAIDDLPKKGFYKGKTANGKFIVKKVKQDDTDQNDLAWEKSFTVHYDEAGDCLVFDQADPRAMAAVQCQWEICRTHYSTDDISRWLSQGIMFAIFGTSLRDSGGFYFVPTEQMSHWESVVAVMGRCSRHKFHRLNPVLDPDSIEAILDALDRESDAMIGVIDKGIEDGKFGQRAMKTKIAELEDQADKLNRYLKAMGTAAPALTEKLEAASARLSMAAMMQMGEAS